MTSATTVTPRKMRPTDFIKTPGVRLWNPDTQMFLHMSGKGETKDVAYSWRGFTHQAKMLEKRAETRGEAWPYKRMKVRAE